MRTILLFNSNENSTHSMNVFSRLARKGKTILLVDLRNSSFKQDESQVGLDISGFLEDSGTLSHYIVNLEPGFDRIRGSSQLHKTAFRVFNHLFKFDIFEPIVKRGGYDYIVFEMSPTLDLLSLNALFASTEVMVYSDMANFLHEDIASFLCDFNDLYTHKVICSQIIPIYDREFNQEDYKDLVTEYSSSFVSYPLGYHKKDDEYGNALNHIVENILFLDDVFDPSSHFDFAMERQKEYEEFMKKMKDFM